MRIKAIIIIIAIGIILRPLATPPKYQNTIIKIDEGDNLNIISRKLKEARIIMQSRKKCNAMVENHVRGFWS